MSAVAIGQCRIQAAPGCLVDGTVASQRQAQGFGGNIRAEQSIKASFSLTPFASASN